MSEPNSEAQYGGQFHWNHGFTFKRIGGLSDPDPERGAKYEWGTVRIRKYKMAILNDENLEWEVYVPPWEWCSIIATVTGEGETGFSFGIAKALHGITAFPSTMKKP